MRLSHPLTESLNRVGDRINIISGSLTHTGASILGRFEQIARMHACPDSSLLCASGDPGDILASLCLPAEGLAPVLLLPSYLRQEIATFAEVVRASTIIREAGATTQTNHSGGALDCRDEVLLVTSGTTGKPKVVRHKLRSILARVRTGISEERVWLLTYLPSSFAGIQVLLTAVLAGELVVQAPRSYSATLALAAETGVTHISCTATFLRALMATGACDSTLPSVRQITLGGEIADQRTLTSAREHFARVRISHIYAATETGALFSVSDGREGFPTSWLQEGVEGVHLKILNESLHVQSPRGMIGYAGENGLNDWIDTGDIVRVEGERVVFAGRRDRRINVGGAKVAPEEVERAIMEVPGVVDAVVAGIPNPLSGQSAVAEIVPADGTDTEKLRERIFAHIRGRLANHQIPRILRFTPTVSLSPAGKKSASFE